DLEKGKPLKIASDEVYVPGVYRDLFGSWSADGAWIAYTVITETNFERAYIYDVLKKRAQPVSDGLSNASNPVFDPSGKYLYLFASTNAGPVVNWFDQSNQDMNMSHSIYLITLQKETPSPLARENDLEELTEDKPEDEKQKAEMPKVSIDWEGIENRIVPIPVSPGYFSSLAVPKEGELYYLHHAPLNSGPTMLHKYDLGKRKGEAIMPMDDFSISANGKKMLYLSKDKWGIA